MTLVTNNERETLDAAAAFSHDLHPGDVVALYGDLGAGKTVFVRGIASGLGLSDDITSPTFTLIHEHSGHCMLYHMDLYRLNSIEEMHEIGIEDYLYGDGVCLIEWAEKLGTLLPRNAIRVTITHEGGSRRRIAIDRKEPCDER